MTGTSEWVVSTRLLIVSDYCTSNWDENDENSHHQKRKGGKKFHNEASHICFAMVTARVTFWQHQSPVEHDDFPHIKSPWYRKTNEQHVWSHRSRHHQPSAAQTDERNQRGRLTIDTLTIAQYQTTAATCTIRRLSRSKSAEPALRRKVHLSQSVRDYWWGFSIDAYNLCKSHPLYGRPSKVPWYTRWHKLWRGRRDSAWWKQIKDLYPRLTGSSCYSNRAIHHKGPSVPGRQTDALLSWC